MCSFKCANMQMTYFIYADYKFVNFLGDYNLLINPKTIM